MITFILPIGSELDYKYTFELLLPSFFHYKDENMKYNFIIIYKSNHKHILDYYYINDKYNYDDFEFFDEELLYTSLITTSTYYFQMYLKLLISKIVKTDFYVTLDADIIFSNSFNINNFYNENLAFCFTVNQLDSWIKRTNKFLEINLTHSINQTPFVFKTTIVKQMLETIDVEKYILQDNCNEYGLFYGFLIKYDLFKDNYIHKNFRQTGLHSGSIKNKSTAEIIKLFHDICSNNFIVVIQSRTNIHYKLQHEFGKIIPNCKFKLGNIAVVSIIGGIDYYNRYKNSIQIKKKYCKKNYYDFHFTFTSTKLDGWAKTLKLLEIMKTKKYEYIFLSDADVTITNFDRRIETIINKYFNSEYICYITTDLNSLNNGNVIWKSCNDSILFIEEMIKLKNDKIIYTISKPFLPKGIYEQPALIYLYNKYEKWRKKIKIIAQFEINSYTPLLIQDNKNVINVIDNIVNRSLWEEEDFLVHYAGANYKKHFINNNFNEHLNKIIRIYQTKFISKKEGKDSGKIK